MASRKGIFFVDNQNSIAHYTVSSLLIPFEANTHSGSERTIRVQATRTTFQELVDALGAAKGVKYATHYLPVEEAVAKEKQAKQDGDELGEVMWSSKKHRLFDFTLPALTHVSSYALHYSRYLPTIPLTTPFSLGTFLIRMLLTPR